MAMPEKPPRPPTRLIEIHEACVYNLTWYVNTSDGGLSALLDLDGSSFMIGRMALVEFSARRVDRTPARPHGISYALVLRPPTGGRPWVRFDNAHAVEPRRRGYRRGRIEYDHWHRTETDAGKPYTFTTAANLIEDFWREVKRTLDEKGIEHDL